MDATFWHLAEGSFNANAFPGEAAELVAASGAAEPLLEQGRRECVPGDPNGKSRSCKNLYLNQSMGWGPLWGAPNRFDFRLWLEPHCKYHIPHFEPNSFCACIAGRMPLDCFQTPVLKL